MAKGMHGKSKRYAMRHGGDHTYYHMRGEMNRGRTSQRDTENMVNHYSSFYHKYQGNHDWELEVQKRYKEYVGVEPCDTTYKIFTEDQQIERYAKNIAFFHNEMMKNLLNEYRRNKMENSKKAIMLRAQSLFPPWVYQKIILRCRELISGNIF